MTVKFFYFKSTWAFILSIRKNYWTNTSPFYNVHTKLSILSYDWISVLLDHSRWHIHPTDGLNIQAQFYQICHSTRQRICSSFMVFVFLLWGVGGQTVTNLAKSLLVKVQTIESLLKNWNWQSEFEDSSSCSSSSRPQAHFSILSSPDHRANTTY